MNTEVIKNIELKITVFTSPTDKEDKYKEYTFICKNCGNKVVKRDIKKLDDYDKIEFDLSLHLMSCEFYQGKIKI